MIYMTNTHLPSLQASSTGASSSSSVWTSSSARDHISVSSPSLSTACSYFSALSSPPSSLSAAAANYRNKGGTCILSVKPYKFRDDPEKRITVKTEMCRAILKGGKCPFHAKGKCNFAHSEDELKYRTYFERHDHGLIDKETYRTSPCLDHVSTGDW